MKKKNFLCFDFLAIHYYTINKAGKANGLNSFNYPIT